MSNLQIQEEKMRDTKVLESFRKQAEKKLKEMNLTKFLKKEVEHGANGTRDYVIKKGVNKGKVAKWKYLRILILDYHLET